MRFNDEDVQAIFETVKNKEQVNLRIDIAKNLLAQALSISAVRSATGLSVDSLKKLLSKNKKEEPCKGAAVSNVITVTVVKCNELAAETQKPPRKDEKIVQ